MPKPVIRFVTIIAVMGVGAAVTVPWVLPGSPPDLALALFAGAALLAVGVPIRIERSGGTQGFTVEGGIFVAMLLSGHAPLAPAVMVAASLVGHSLRTRHPAKVLFNVGRSGLETTLAALWFLAIAPTAPSPTRAGDILAAASAAVVFELVSSAVMVELFHRLSGMGRDEAIRDVGRMALITFIGNTGYGIVLAVIASVNLLITGMAASLMLVTYLGYRGYAVALEGKRRAEAVNEVSHYLLDLIARENGLEEFLLRVVDVFGGRNGRLLVETPQGLRASVLADGVCSTDRLESLPRSGLLARAMAEGHGVLGTTTAEQEVEDAIVAPILGRAQRPIGAVAVEGRRGLEPWDTADANLLAAIANELAVALDNVVLFQQVEDERARLEAETEKLNDILGAASDGIASILAGGTIEAWNPGMARITGVEAEAAVGQPWHAVLRLKDASGTDLAPTGNHVMRRALRGELRDEAISLQALRTDGAWRWLQCTASPVRHPDGEQRGLVLVARDVTAERELDDLKADFIATVSHELRTPLTPLKGFLATLRNPQTQLTHDQVQTIHTSMGSQLTRLETLIADLLAVAELDHGQFDLRPEPMAIGEVVADAVRVEAADQFLRCSLEMDQDVVAVADPVALVRIVRSLTSNAIKHTDGRITVHVVEADGAVEVRIRDEGPGIAPWDQDRVFNRFERLGDHLRRTQGPGLGLTIARTLAQRMGGNIRVDSELGQGATFVLSLPRAALRPVPLRAVSDA